MFAWNIKRESLGNASLTSNSVSGVCAICSFRLLCSKAWGSCQSKPANLHLVDVALVERHNVEEIISHLHEGD